MTAVQQPATSASPAGPAGSATAGWARMVLGRRGWRDVLGAAAAGAGLLVSFPPYDLWWLAPVGVGLLAVIVYRRRLPVATGLGLVAGLVFFVPLLSWTGLHVGAVPWLLLACSQAAILSLVGVGTALAAPLLRRHPWCWPVVTGTLWVAQEAVRDRVPFGGFPWGRLAFSQAGSPLLRLAALGGAPLVTFAVAGTGGLLAVAVTTWRWPGRGSGVPAWARTGTRTLAALLVVPVSLAVPLGHPGGAEVTVAVIQGNVPRLGLDFNAQRRAVLDNHVRATLALARSVRAGAAPAPALVVWPENASDIDPLIPADADAYDLISEAARQINAPILLGAVLVGPGTHARNAGIVWDPVTGPGAMYVKQHPVPFAEYMPLRRIARWVSSKADLVASDFVAGHRAGVLRVGPATVGDVICFEVAYDNIVRDAVTGGGQLVVVQTNNADFDTAEARQQLAMVRLRAVEFGRDALMASTVGVSAFVGADGRVHNASRFDTQATLVRTVRLGGERTLASVLGPVPEWVLAAVAVALLLAAVRLRRRARRAGAGGAVAATTTGTATRTTWEEA